MLCRRNSAEVESSFVEGELVGSDVEDVSDVEATGNVLTLM